MKLFFLSGKVYLIPQLYVQKIVNSINKRKSLLSMTSDDESSPRQVNECRIPKEESTILKIKANDTAFLQQVFNPEKA